MVIQICQVVVPWPLDKPALLDWLNLVLNLNQDKGPHQLSWTLTFRVISTWSLNLVTQLSPSTLSLNFVPKLGPTIWSLNLVPQLCVQLFIFKFIALHKGVRDGLSNPCRLTVEQSWTVTPCPYPHWRHLHIRSFMHSIFPSIMLRFW